MRITTDSIILGAAASLIGDEQRILDIGTGCGILALLMAQRTEHYSEPVAVDALDIDGASVQQATQNALNSPWAERITIWQQDVVEYAASATAQGKYDLIISNPPYFDAATPTRNAARQHARYTISLNHHNLFEIAAQLLHEGGRLVMILPFQALETVQATLATTTWHMTRQLLIRHQATQTYKLVIVEFARTAQLGQSLCLETLTLKTPQGQYTQDYYQLVAPYKPFDLNKVACAALK